MSNAHNRTAVLLGGPTGVGKTSTLALLKDAIPKSAVLDADDVWRVDPDLQVAGTRSIAIENTLSVMRGYFAAGCEVGILSWVFARRELYGPVVEALKGTVDSITQIYLIADEKRLEERLRERGDLDRLEYSISRLRLIEDLPFRKVDTSNLEPWQVADKVRELIHEGV